MRPVLAHGMIAIVKIDERVVVVHNRRHQPRQGEATVEHCAHDCVTLMLLSQSRVSWHNDTQRTHLPRTRLVQYLTSACVNVIAAA